MDTTLKPYTATWIAASIGPWRRFYWASRDASCATASPPNRAHLFIFVTTRDMPYTNDVSERHLDPSLISAR
jgi:hypothetical protein